MEVEIKEAIKKNCKTKKFSIEVRQNNENLKNLKIDFYNIQEIGPHKFYGFLYLRQPTQQSVEYAEFVMKAKNDKAIFKILRSSTVSIIKVKKIVKKGKIKNELIQ